MRIRREKGNRSILCKCGNLARKGQRWCNDCHSAYQRKNRKRHSQMSQTARKRANARSKLHLYIKRGKVTKGVCCICGNPKVEAHHEDYDKALDVIWLCRPHHIEYHENQKEVAPTFFIIDDKLVRIKT